jgi:hypothetical protein
MSSFDKQRKIVDCFLFYNKVDILKYSLASFSKIYPWSKVILKIQLDNAYSHRQEELKQFILQEFQGRKLHLEWIRNIKQKDWQATYDLFDDHLIWYCGNHDHIYIDNNLKYLNNIINDLSKYDVAMMCYSHYPEFIRNSHIAGNPVELQENSINFISGDIDAVHIVTKELYKLWWFGNDVSQYDFPRPDWKTWLRPAKGDIPEALCLVPYRELCRHFDGYTAFNITNNVCPAIEIPDGFFDNNIKISHGTFQRKSGFINLNALNKNYIAFDNSGTDYKFNLEDIPEFWKTRISKIEKFNVDQNLLKKYRLKAIFDMFNFEQYTLPELIKERIAYHYKNE